MLSTLLLVIVGSSCAVVHNPGKSPLTRPRMSPDSVVLDIVSIRIPFGQEEANRGLWDEVDELHFPAEVRRQLNKSGFRAGVVAGQIPVALARLLETTDKPAPNAGEAQEVNLAEVEAEPRVVWRHLQCRRAQRAEILASHVYDELPVLTTEANGLCGQTYLKAQGVLGAKAFPEPDGRVRIDITPELHHGESRQRFVENQGMLRMEAGRSRRVFDNLALSATLAPGHLLLLSCLPSRPGSLGHHFFTSVTSGQREQKLLVIRLSQTQHNGLFDPEGPLPLDNADPQASASDPAEKRE
ncbi:MAG: hypothetical protein ABFD16_09205 [Thermoguttaceae bacterium]